MKQLFHTTTSKPLNAANPEKSTRIIHEDSYEYPEKPAKASKSKDRRKTSIDTTNHFPLLSPDENPTDTVRKDSSLDDVCEIATIAELPIKKLMKYPEKINFQ